MTTTNRKRALDSYLKEQEERFNDVMKLSYADRLKVFRNEWTELYHLRDTNPDKQMRVALETGIDPNVQNAAERINFYSQKPRPDQLDDLIRTQTTTANDRFMKLVEQIDELKSVIEQIEPSALRALAATRQVDFLRDLRSGRYDPGPDTELMKQMYEKEQAEQTESDETKPDATETETKSDETKTDPPAVETKSDETKTDQPPEPKSEAAETPVPPVETKSGETKSESAPVVPVVAPVEVVQSDSAAGGGGGAEIKMDAPTEGIPATVSA
jgi:hypothetical protein